MSKRVCAVLGSDSDYIRRFSGYINKRKGLPFVLFSFTEMEALEEFLRTENADLILLAEDEDPEKTLSGAEYAKKTARNSPEVIILGQGDPSLGKFRLINRYQSMEAIISEITDLLNEKEKLENPPAFSSPGLEITGIFSLDGPLKAADLALDLARRFPEGRKTLYINLTRFSGLSEKFEEPVSGSFSDIIYYFKNHSEKTRSAFCAARGNIFPAQVLTGPENPEDLDLLEDEDWKDLLFSLAEFAGADELILDVSEGFKDLSLAFDLCRKIYIVCDKNTDLPRINELGKYLEKTRRQDLFEKIFAAP